MIVVDVNLVAYLLLQSENTDLAEQVFNRDAEWFGSVLWRSEFRNILVNYLHRKLLTLENARLIMDKAHALFDDHEYFVSSEQVLELAASSGCTAYDCEYVALARQLGLALITFDRDILQHFPEIAKSPQDFLNG